METISRRRVYRVNAVEIDTALGWIRRDGEETYLRPKARLVLSCLIDRRASPVSKDDLLRVAWEGAAVTDDTLVNCIQELRRALGDDARNPTFIRTMPKTGYWFIAPVEVAAEPEAETAVPVLDEPPAPTTPVTTRKRWKAGVAVSTAAVVALAIAGWWIWRAPQSASHWEIAWWKLDEGSGPVVADFASRSSAPLPPGVAWTPGIAGAALLFRGHDVVLRGAGRRVSRGDRPDRTLVAWVKMPHTEADTAVVMAYGEPDPDPRSDTLSLIVHPSGRGAVTNNWSAVMSRSRVDDGNWHQVAGVLDGARRHARIFVDGVEEAGGAMSDVDPRPDRVPQWSIGRGMRAGTPFRGAVDDVRVFARALHPAEIQALFRCLSGAVDLDSPGGPAYFAPAAGMNVAIDPRRPGESSARVRNTGTDYAAASFVLRRPGCALQSTLASDMGQDLHVELDLRVGGNAADRVAEAGPYFRSRRSAPGDGIVGGTSAGYWVQLTSTGQVRVRRLHPTAILAFTQVPAAFDPDAFHRLAVDVRGGSLEASLDGRPLEFDQAGARAFRVDIPPTWETASPRGVNRGAVGVAFSCDANRWKTGGQEARNIRLSQ